MYRGRGRGRGWGGGGGYGFAKQEPFELWPEVELPDVNGVKEEKNLIIWNRRLCNYWKSSPYYLEETVAKKNKSVDIERYCDWRKPKTTTKRDSIFQFLQLESNNFPKELVGDSRSQQRNPKRVRWNPDQDLERLDHFEKLERKFEGREGKGEKGKKEGDEDEDEDEDEENEESEEESSDGGDYDKNIDFDDDEDDFNMDDDGNEDDAAVYED